MLDYGTRADVVGNPIVRIICHLEPLTEGSTHDRRPRLTAGQVGRHVDLIVRTPVLSASDKHFATRQQQRSAERDKKGHSSVAPRDGETGLSFGVAMSAVSPPGRAAMDGFPEFSVHLRNGRHYERRSRSQRYGSSNRQSSSTLHHLFFDTCRRQARARRERWRKGIEAGQRKHERFAEAAWFSCPSCSFSFLVEGLALCPDCACSLLRDLDT